MKILVSYKPYNRIVFYIGRLYSRDNFPILIYYNTAAKITVWIIFEFNGLKCMI